MNSEQKMREALEQIKSLTEIPFAHTAGDHELIYQIASEALAAPAGEQVGLTDAELHDAWSKALSGRTFVNQDQWFLTGLRAVIAAHEAKRNGGAV